MILAVIVIDAQQDNQGKVDYRTNGCRRERTGEFNKGARGGIRVATQCARLHGSASLVEAYP